MWREATLFARLCLRLACASGSIFFVQAGSDLAAAGDILCDQWNAAAIQVNNMAPRWIDPVTRWDGMIVLCDKKTIENFHFVSSRRSELRDGWQERARQRLEAIACDDRQLKVSLAEGWTLADTVEFADGERVLLQLDCPPG